MGVESNDSAILLPLRPTLYRSGASTAHACIPSHSHNTGVGPGALKALAPLISINMSGLNYVPAYSLCLFDSEQIIWP
jgi:hypothetical protein